MGDILISILVVFVILSMAALIDNHRQKMQSRHVLILKNYKGSKVYMSLPIEYDRLELEEIELYYNKEKYGVTFKREDLFQKKIDLSDEVVEKYKLKHEDLLDKYKELKRGLN